MYKRRDAEGELSKESAEEQIHDSSDKLLVREDATI